MVSLRPINIHSQTANVTLTQRSIRCGLIACALGAFVAIAGCGSSGAQSGRPAGPTASAASAASAPACLPTTLGHSAQLAGTSVDVSPAPGTGTADPHTQISFLGAKAAQIHSVSVHGSSSGEHSGRLAAYSQGDGASFMPSKPFAAGEQVTVRAAIGSGKGKQVNFSFHVDTPWPTSGVGAFPNPASPPGDYQTFETLSGVQAPILTVTAPDHDAGAGDVFLTNGPGPGRYGAMIYNSQGQLVWDDQLSGGMVAEDLSVQSYQGHADLTFWQGKVLSLGFGQGEDVVLNSSYQTVATVRGGNGLLPDLHDFQIASGDVAYATAFNPIRCDLGKAQGPHDGVILDAVILEIDIKTGLVRWEWHALDHVAASESEGSPPPHSAWDWFHINSIDPEPNGNVLISARNTWAAYQLEKGTGNILWRLGGLKSSFKMGPGTKTAWQHDARMQSNGDVTIFDDGSDPAEEPQSRAVRIALDLKGHAARLVSAYTHPSPPLLAASQGNVQTLSNGDSVVGYGGVPVVTEFAKNGTVVFDAHLPLDQLFYRAFRFPWNARPASPPAVLAALNNTAEETIVHMSWNGATGVAAWRVLAGKTQGSLQTQATIRPSGFETSTILPKSYRYVAVAALDSGGHVLGTSHATAVKTFASSFPGASK
jgi:Arylsulfotransferase (ASST)